MDNTERLIRKELRKAGCLLRKNRARNVQCYNYGGYMIVDGYTNTVVAGSDYTFTLEDVIEWAEGLEE